MHYVVTGGGVAGVSCAYELCRLCPEDRVTLIAASSSVKYADVKRRITAHIEETQLREVSLTDDPIPANLRPVLGIVTGLDLESKALQLSDGKTVQYDKLCIATGGVPIELPGAEGSGRVAYLRDAASIRQLADKLQGLRRIAVVGNGGIALELVHALGGLDLTWVVRHEHIGDAFFDADAAGFLLECLTSARHAGDATGEEMATTIHARQTTPALCSMREGGDAEDGGAEGGDARPVKRFRPAGSLDAPPHDTSQSAKGNTVLVNVPDAATPGQTVSAVHGGHALGPTWIKRLRTQLQAGGGHLDVRLGVEVVSFVDKAGCAALELSDGSHLAVDLVVAALGVRPCTGVFSGVPGLELSPAGGVVVDERLQSSVQDVYAAGDACAALALENSGAPWFQMRLWTQARSEGVYAAQTMAGVEESLGAGMAFELFTHVTFFAGHRVILLGRYNGQGLEQENETDLVSYARAEPPDGQGRHGTFVRLLLLRGRVQGAVLIGETDLEEAVEHLIMDQLDVGQYGPSLLDPEFELDHVFD